MTASGEGLRERLRRTVREELASVALEMFVERGFDATTVDAIAAAAGVSRSTFFRHFATKEDAVLSRSEVLIEQFRQAARARPAGEPPMVAARGALIPLIADMTLHRERSAAIATLIATTPTLRARILDKQSFMRTTLTEVMAERLGVDPAIDLRPDLIAATTLSLLDVAHKAWLRGGNRSLADLVDEGFATLRHECATSTHVG